MASFNISAFDTVLENFGASAGLGPDSASDIMPHHGRKRCTESGLFRLRRFWSTLFNKLIGSKQEKNKYNEYKEKIKEKTKNV